MQRPPLPTVQRAVFLIIFEQTGKKCRVEAEELQRFSVLRTVYCWPDADVRATAEPRFR
jgi:hypothetical protein